MSSTTVVLVPRESFSTVPRGLRATAAAVARDTRVVLVDGASPRRIRRHLVDVAERNDYLLLGSDQLLSPNRARNAAVQFVDTEFVLFVDYETEMPVGTVERLERCAHETGAAIVGPVYLEGAIGTTTQVHMAGGECHFVGPADARHFVDRHAARHATTFSAVAPIRTEQVEFHCLLVRTSVLEQLGGFDEQLLANRDHSDLCLSVRDSGHEIFVDPDTFVYYSRPRLPTLADIEYCLVRWSDTWSRLSIEHFCAKWNVAADDPANEIAMTWGTAHRWYTYRPYLSLVSRCFGTRRRDFYRWFDRHAQQWAERRHPVEASRNADIVVAHAATWTSALASRA